MNSCKRTCISSQRTAQCVACCCRIATADLSLQQCDSNRLCSRNVVKVATALHQVVFAIGAWLCCVLQYIILPSSVDWPDDLGGTLAILTAAVAIPFAARFARHYLPTLPCCRKSERYLAPTNMAKCCNGLLLSNIAWIFAQLAKLAAVSNSASAFISPALTRAVAAIFNRTALFDMALQRRRSILTNQQRACGIVTLVTLLACSGYLPACDGTFSSPASVSGLAQWFDAADLYGNQTVVPANTPVTFWRDKAEGRDLVTVAGNPVPLLRVDAEGRRFVSMNSSNSLTNSYSQLGVGGRSSYLVFGDFSNVQGSAANDGLPALLVQGRAYGSGGAAWSLGYVQRNTLCIGVNFASVCKSNASQPTLSPTNGGTLAVASWSIPASNAALAVNMTLNNYLLGTKGTFFQPEAYGPNISAADAKTTLGRGATETRYFEYLHYDRDVGSSDHAAIIEFLAKKWGVVVKDVTLGLSSSSVTRTVSLTRTTSKSSSTSQAASGSASNSATASVTPTASLSQGASPSLSATISESPSSTGTETASPSATPTTPLNYDQLPPLLIGGPWAACTVPCGGGTQYRDAFCLHDGIVDQNLTYCSNAASIVTSRECNTDSCIGAYWLPTNDWSPCSSQCISASNASSMGVSTRTPAVCMYGPRVMSEQVCDDAGLVRPPSVRTCNRVPCPSSFFAWNADLWSECMTDNGCGAGIAYRSVSCIGITGEQVSPGHCNVTVMPATDQRCDTGVPCDCTVGGNAFCAASVGNHSICVEGIAQCGCVEGWSGADCNTYALVGGTGTTGGQFGPDGGGFIPQPKCETGQYHDSAGECCEVIDTVTGLCCAVGERVAADGRCCAGQLDGCGVCNGVGLVRDRFGTCCLSILSATGVCCEDANGVDSCGVCGGVNECGVNVTMTMSSLTNLITLSRKRLHASGDALHCL